MTRVELLSVYLGMASFKHREELEARLNDGWRIIACVFAPQEASMPSRMIYTLAMEEEPDCGAQQPNR